MNYERDLRDSYEKTKRKNLGITTFNVEWKNERGLPLCPSPSQVEEDGEEKRRGWMVINGEKSRSNTN